MSGFATIKLGRAIFCDALQRGGEFGLLKRIASMKHFSVTQENMAANSEMLQHGAFSVQLPCKFFADRETVLREMNRGRHNVGKFQLAIGF